MCLQQIKCFGLKKVNNIQKWISDLYNKSLYFIIELSFCSHLVFYEKIRVLFLASKLMLERDTFLL